MKPTTNARELVSNAMSRHNNDPWYLDLLEAALERDDVPTVNDAIMVANMAYGEGRPIINEEQEDIVDLGEVVENEDSEEEEDEDEETGFEDSEDEEEDEGEEEESFNDYGVG